MLRWTPARSSRRVGQTHVMDKKGQVVSVALWVGDRSFEIGAASFFNAFFSTVFARAEGDSWGSRYPMLMKELYSGTLRPELVPKALLEVRALRSDLAKLPVSALVWNHEDRSATPPWGDQIAPHIKTLADYFVTSDGKNLLDVLETAFSTSGGEHAVTVQ